MGTEEGEKGPQDHIHGGKEAGAESGEGGEHIDDVSTLSLSTVLDATHALPTLT